MRLSFKITSAALVSRLEVIPPAIADIVWMEQGATTMASMALEPLARRAPISSNGYQKCANLRASAASFPVSRNSVFSPDFDRIR